MPSFSALILTAAAAGSSYAALEAYGGQAPSAHGSESSSASVYNAPEQSYAPKHSSLEPQWYSAPANAPEYTTTTTAEYPSQTYGYEAPSTSCTEEEVQKTKSTFVPWYTNQETTQLASVYSMYPTISIDTSSYATTSASVNVPYYPHASSYSKPEEHQTYSQNFGQHETYTWSTTEEQKNTYATQTYEQTWFTEEAVTYPAQTYSAPVYHATESASVHSSGQSTAPVYQPESPKSSGGSTKYVYSTLTNTVTCESCQATAPATGATTAPVYASSAPSAPVYHPQESAPAYAPSASENSAVRSQETSAPSPPISRPYGSAPASAPVMEMQPSVSTGAAYPGVPEASWVPASTYPVGSATATKHLTIVPVPATMATYAGAASPTGASSYGYGNSTGNSTNPWKQPASYTGGASMNTFSIAALTIAIFGAAFAL